MGDVCYGVREINVFISVWMSVVGTRGQVDDFLTLNELPHPPAYVVPLELLIYLIMLVIS
jgi:hypothetical protein